MRYAVTGSEMKIYDRNTSEYFGVSGEVLMERASLEVVDDILEHIRQRSVNRKYRALVFAGVGNNGGDGACIARILSQRGVLVTLCVVGDMTRASDLILKQLRTAEKYGIVTDTFSNIRDNKSASNWDIIVDALFGVGLSRPVLGDYKLAIDYMNACKTERSDDLYVVAVDIPSGIHSDTGEIMGCCVKADTTVTFNQVKLGHIMYPGCEYVGKLVIGDAGITDDSFLDKPPLAFYYDERVCELLPQRDPASNKGSNGKILIIAGSKEISGALCLCAGACLKAGAGMVKVFTAVNNAETVKTLIPEAMLTTYDEFEPVTEKLSKEFKWATGIVIGPGLDESARGYELVNEVLSSFDKDIVVDAGALNVISRNDDLKQLLSEYGRGNKKVIITPHIGEFARLYGESAKDCKKNILEYPGILAKRLHCTVICKDARSVVADSNSKKIYINVSGNDGMATAGSGDVLSGILGALLGSGLGAFEIASIGCYIHGKAGDLAADKLGRYSMVASDIIEELPELLR